MPKIAQPRSLTSTRTRKILMTAVLVLAVSITGTMATAATSWKTFGSGTATGRGDSWSAPEVWLDSTTQRNPDDVRFVVTNTAAGSRRVSVYWTLSCERSNGFSTYKSGDFRATIGKGKKLIRTPSIPSNAQWCDVWVSVNHTGASLGDGGKLSLALQARY